MNLGDVKSILEAEVILDGTGLDSTTVEMGCGADLMSDVLAHAEAGSLLLTGLTNPQVMRTAEMAGVRAICFVRGKRPQSETISLAKASGVPLLLTHLPMFESCGRLYKEGLIGRTEKK